MVKSDVKQLAKKNSNSNAKLPNEMKRGIKINSLNACISLCVS